MGNKCRIYTIYLTEDLYRKLLEVKEPRGYLSFSSIVRLFCLKGLASISYLSEEQKKALEMEETA